jgi:hypothetical protein
MGTSVSMGWQSDGGVAWAQQQSWPAQLAALSGYPLSLPLIDGTGCVSPFRAPLASGVRMTGEPVTTPKASLICTALQAGITLPTRNVAIAGAETSDALFLTPELVTDPFYAKLYARVLPPHTTQVQAMEMQQPQLVSVELGANEVLGATSGVAIPGVTIVPVAVWQPDFLTLLTRVAQATPKAVLVGLIKDAATFPSFRRGSEIWADRAAFLQAFYVDVQRDCMRSANLIFTPVRVPSAVAAGAAAKAAHGPPAPFSCAGAAPNVQDNVLTPPEVAIVNDALRQMTRIIATEAKQRGYAYFALDALYGRSDLKPPFSSIAFMSSNEPYGSYMSLDGIHPNAAGNAILASAAARAINARYDLGLPIAPSLIVGAR